MYICSMPVDFQQIYQRIREIGADVPGRHEVLEGRRKKTRDLLYSHDNQLEALRIRVDKASAIDPNLRCAVPLREQLTASFPTATSYAKVNLIATDGSQVNPDRHAGLMFSLLNVGAIVMKLNSGTIPEIHTHSDLYYGMELEENKLTSEGSISLRRDLNERTFAERLINGLVGPIVILTDGPLEIWGVKDSDDPGAYERSVRSHLTALSLFQSRGVATAGYVDKPEADLVVRLLELVTDFPEKRDELRSYHPLQGMSDLWLFGFQNQDFQLLKPGERSAVFRLQSSSGKYYQDELSLHFFYLNVGDNPRHPQIARVEIPRWVVDDKRKLDLLHSIVVDQCRSMGSKPYPYVLARAHEIAVINQEEKGQIEHMLALEIIKQGGQVGEVSNKLTAKESLVAGGRRHSS